MDNRFSPHRLRLATISGACAGAMFLGLTSETAARVTEITIATPPNTPAFAARASEPANTR